MLDWNLEHGCAFRHSDTKRSHISEIRYTFQLRRFWLLRLLHIHPKGNSGNNPQRRFRYSGYAAAVYGMCSPIGPRGTVRRWTR